MDEFRNRLQGLWLPLVTPFCNGALDETSLRRLVRCYAASPVDGFILAATSGEGLLLSTTELGQLVTLVRAELSESHRTFPICLGLAGASTAVLRDTLDETT
jgi:4-hydroxy-tetrahydrodipicolinate synthase